MCVLICFLSSRQAEQLLVQHVDLVVAENPGHFVLLLRPFEIDDHRFLGETGFMPNFEQTLVYGLQHIGPVIAVGRPNEKLAPKGASRLYLQHEDWRPRVEQLMQQARVVVLILFTDSSADDCDEAYGFSWEIEQAISSIDPLKVLFVLPAATKLLTTGLWWPRLRQKEIQRRRALRRFLTEINATLPSAGGDDHAAAQFLCLDPDRNLKPLRARWGRNGAAGVRDALRPFFAALGLPPTTTSHLLLGFRFNVAFRIVCVVVGTAFVSTLFR